MSEENTEQQAVSAEEQQKPALSEAQQILAADTAAANAAADAEAAKKKSKVKAMPAGIAFIRATYHRRRPRWRHLLELLRQGRLQGLPQVHRLRRHHGRAGRRPHRLRPRHA